jgi:hypothetical protein
MKLHKTEVGKKRTERAQIKKSNFQRIKVDEKRLTDDGKINKSRKRARIVRSHLNNYYLITELTLQ